MATYVRTQVVVSKEEALRGLKTPAGDSLATSRKVRSPALPTNLYLQQRYRTNNSIFPQMVDSGATRLKLGLHFCLSFFVASGLRQNVVKVKDDPAFAKFFKMLKIHLPRGAVEQKMLSEGVDPAVLDMDPDEPSPNQPSDPEEEKTGDVEEDPKYSKYRRMLKVHLPEGAVRLKMESDGIDAEIIEEFFS